MKTPIFIKNNLLFKVTSANTLLVVVRMLFAIVSQKVLAILVGAEGIAQVGNLKNIFNFFEQFTILGTSNGLVKYISEYKNDKIELNNLFSTAFVFTLLGTIFSFIILFFGSDLLSQVIFGQKENYAFIFKVLSFIIPFMGINVVLFSLLNGLSEYKIYSKTTLVSIILNTSIIVILTYKMGLSGSLLAISITPLIQFVSYLFFYSKGFKEYINIKSLTFSLSFKKQLLSYSFMSLIVLLFVNVTDLAIRNLLENRLNISEAGYWTAMTSISRTYMQFLAAIFPLYILPRYSKINNTFEFRNEVLNIYKFLLPLIIIGMLIVFIFRNPIIRLLYTDDFLVMENLFKWQLLGDLVKFIAIVISYQFLAKRQIVYYIFTELLSVLLLYGFSVYFIDIYGTEGVVIAHFMRYSIYLVVVVYILRNSFLGKNKVF